MVDICALNSRIKFNRTDVPFDQREILGDATETGLARFAGKAINDYDNHQSSHPKVFEVPFNSANKWALVIVSCRCLRAVKRFRDLALRLQVEKPHEDGALSLYIKGAPERILGKCTSYLLNGEMVPISEEFRKQYDDAYNVRIRQISPVSRC